MTNPEGSGTIPQPAAGLGSRMGKGKNMIKDGERRILQRDKLTYAIRRTFRAVWSARHATQDRRRGGKIRGGRHQGHLGAADRHRGPGEEQIDDVWRDLGMSPGHAIGLCVRSIKVCPGTTFCKGGLQDSIAMGMEAGREVPRHGAAGQVQDGRQRLPEPVRRDGRQGCRRGGHRPRMEGAGRRGCRRQSPSSRRCWPRTSRPSARGSCCGHGRVVQGQRQTARTRRAGDRTAGCGSLKKAVGLV